MAKAPAKLEERLSSYFQNFVEAENGCWLWLGKPNKTTGYGRVNLFGKCVQVHRLFYERHVGPIKIGEEIHHKCENRICVNPSYLVAVTRKVHVGESNSPPGINSRKAHCKKGHRYDLQTDSGRWCSICRREWGRKYYADVRRTKLIKGTKPGFYGHKGRPGYRGGSSPIVGV